MCDVFYDGRELHLFVAGRTIPEICTARDVLFHRPIATCLAQGFPMYEAVELAKTYITKVIEAGKDLHIGHGNGPLWHFPSLVNPMNPAGEE